MASYLSSLFTTVDSVTSSYIGSSVGNVMGAVAPVFHQMFLLYVMLWGFAMYRGLIEEPILDGAFRLMKVALVMELAIGAGTYSSLIAGNIQALPDFLGGLFGAGGTVAASQTTLDNILTKCLEIGNALYEEAGVFDGDFGLYIQAAIVWIAAIVSVGYAAFLIVLAKVGLALFIAAGPIAMACLLFQGTQKFFEAWVGQVLNFAFVNAFAVGMVAMLFGMFQSTATASLGVVESGDGGFMSIISLILVSAILFLVLMQVQSFASAFAGGVSVSTMGAIRAAGRRMGNNPVSRGVSRSVERGAERATNAAGRGAKSAAMVLPNWAMRKFGGNSIKKAA